MEPVLPIKLSDFDANVEYTNDISGMTAEQYLSWVRVQADKLPLVKVATNIDTSRHVQSKYMPEIREISECPSQFKPNNEWVQEVLKTFTVLRDKLTELGENEENRARLIHVPPLKHIKSWSLFCFGSEDGGEAAESTIGKLEEEEDVIMHDQDELTRHKQTLSATLGLEDVEITDTETANATKKIDGSWDGNIKQIPTTGLLLQFDNVMTQKLLDIHTEWLETCLMTELRGQWLYGLLSRLQLPLYHETSAIIRKLYRRCCTLRRELIVDSDTFDADLGALNVIISITGIEYGQAEHINDMYISYSVSQMVQQEFRKRSSDRDDDDEEEDDDDEVAGERKDLIFGAVSEEYNARSDYSEYAAYGEAENDSGDDDDDNNEEEEEEEEERGENDVTTMKMNLYRL